MGLLSLNIVPSFPNTRLRVVPLLSFRSRFNHVYLSDKTSILLVLRSLPPCTQTQPSCTSNPPHIHKQQNLTTGIAPSTLHYPIPFHSISHHTQPRFYNPLLQLAIAAIARANLFLPPSATPSLPGHVQSLTSLSACAASSSFTHRRITLALARLRNCARQALDCRTGWQARDQGSHGPAVAVWSENMWGGEGVAKVLVVRMRVVTMRVVRMMEVWNGK